MAFRSTSKAWGYVCMALLAGSALGQSSQTLMELELQMQGLHASLETPAPVVPKGMAAGLRVVVKAGERELSAAELSAFLGTPGAPASFQVQGELSGPGLQGTLSLPGPNQPANLDVLTLALPALVPAGEYHLANLRLVSQGQTVLDLQPAQASLRVIDQVLVSNVVARPLSLDEIRERGIVLDSDAYLGFEFHVALKLESEVVPFSFPAVFTREGVALPLTIAPPAIPQRSAVLPPPQLQPMMLVREGWEDPEGGGGDTGSVGGGAGRVAIPGLLVIPGDVAFLKQFVAAKLYVANGAPQGSPLSVRDVVATLELPPGADGQVGTDDDPLALPEILEDGAPVAQSLQMPVLGEQGQTAFGPREQGSSEYVLRGEREGLHELGFQLKAVLDGLAAPDGTLAPVPVVGRARGAVLVRNPFFHMTFSAPSVVRAGEPFTFYATVTNVGQAPAYAFRINVEQPSGATLVVAPGNTPERDVEELKAGDARTFEFRFTSQLTGRVVGKYLRLFGSNATGSNGSLSFTVGVDERGVLLSPDTLQLPAAVDTLPAAVVPAAMRVLGQAWSVAKAPYQQLPAGVQRIPESVARLKVLAVAEAGLRAQLLGGGAPAQRAALRELLSDLYRAERYDPALPADVAFDQLLRQTSAGRDLVAAIGAQLGAALPSAGAALDYEAEASEIAASGRNFVAFAVSTGDTRDADVALLDSHERATRVAAGAWEPVSGVPSAVLVPLGAGAQAPVWGFVSSPSGSYVLELRGRASGSADVSATLPSGDGHSFRRAVLAGLELRAGSRTVIAIDPWQPQSVLVAQDLDGDGHPDGAVASSPTQVLEAQGPRLLGAAVVGPETFAGASEFGFHLAMVFDRAVDAVSAADVQNYVLQDNLVVGAKRQLSGRLVFAQLRGPEGPYLAQTVGVSGLADERQHVGVPSSVPLQVRLLSPGASVHGRVLRPGGQAVTTGEVYYVNSPDYGFHGIPTCRTPQAGQGLTALPLGPAGYELRYVKQSRMGCPFYVVYKDPVTGAQRQASARVQVTGGALSLDILLDGVGTVAGQVRNRYSLQPIAGARVVATSNADPQSGASALTDVQGRYSIPGITVGPVTVRAAKGLGSGFASGRIASAGQTATVDVGLDDGALSIGGHVRQLVGANPVPAVGALVVIRFDGVPVAWRYAGPDGGYLFTGMPAGSFSVSASFENLSAELGGQAYAGIDIDDHDLWVVVPPASSEHQDVVGHVYMGDGTPAADALVWSSGVPAVMTAADGAFLLPDVPVPGSANTPVILQARSADQRRQTSGQVTIGVGYQMPDDLALHMPGLSSVVLTVLDPSGFPVGGGVEVKLRGSCMSLCGCDTRHTDANGKVTFEAMPAGQRLDFHTYRQLSPTLWDYARTAVTSPADGLTVFGVLRYGGVGSVTVKVQDEQQQPVSGSQVWLTAPVFRGVNGCTLVNEVRGPLTTPLTTGEVVFPNVLVAGGSYSVSATHPFDPQSVSAASGTLTHAGEADHVLLTLRERMAGRLSGKVFGADGEPVGAGVEVTLLGMGIPTYTVVTQGGLPGDPTYGAYQFSPVLPAGSYVLTARDPRPGHEPQVSRDVVSLPVGQDRSYDLHLKGRGSVRVTVVDGQGPVARGQVTLQELSYPHTTYERPFDVGSQGMVEFDAVYAGPFSVAVKDVYGRGGRTNAVMPAAGQAVDVTVRVAATGCVTGRFELPDQSPIPSALVKLLGGPGMGVIGQATTEGVGAAAGTFAFDYVPLGQVRLQGHDPLTGRNGIAAGALTVESHLGDPQPQCLALDLRAESLGDVHGTVTSNGSPQAGIEVEIVSGQYRARTASDADGLYALEGVPAGQVTATAKAPGGYLTGSATATLASEGQVLTLDVALRDSVEVLGQLLRHDGQAAGAVSEIRLTGPSAPPTNPMKTYSDAAGSFHFQQAPVGVTRFDADALTSVDRGSANQELERPGPANVTIQLQGTGRLKGQAQDAAGNPVAGRVEVWAANGVGFSNHYFVVGSSGNFVVPELLAGDYTLKLKTSLGSAQLFGTATVSVAPTADPNDPQDWTNAVVRLEPTGRVSGTVLRADHQTPAYGAEVVLKVTHAQSGLTLTLAAQTGAGGRFEIQGVPLGSLVGTVRDPVSGGLLALPARTLAAQDALVDYGMLELSEDAFHVVSVSPADGAVGVALDTPVDVTFSAPVASVGGVKVTKPGGITLAWVATVLDEGRTWRLRPFVSGAGYTGDWPHTSTMAVEVWAGIYDVFGRALGTGHVTHFSTPDQTGPVVVALQPANTAIQVPGNAVVRATFDEPLLPADYSAAMTLKLGVTPLAGSVALEPPATLAFTPQSALPTDVQLTASVAGAIDALGNVQAGAQVWSFKTLDTQAPNMAVSTTPGSPASGWLKQSPTRLNAMFSDTQSGLDEATLFMKLDGVSVPTLEDLNLSSFYHAPPVPLADGQHSLQAGMRDLAGNLAQASHTFGIDTVAPSAPVIHGLPAGNVLHGVATLTFDVVDTASGVDHVDLFLDGTQASTNNVPPAFQIYLNTTEGPHSLSVRAVDKAGNIGPSTPAQIEMDQIVLNVNMVQPAANALLRDTVTITAAVNESGASVDFAVAGGAPVTDSSSPYQATLSLASVPEGLVTISATAHGVNGETDTDTRQIRVDRTAPAAPDASKITAAAPQAGASLVHGTAGAVEAGTQVSIQNLDNGQQAACVAASDGRFTASILAASGQHLRIVATDGAQNASAPTDVIVAEPGPSSNGSTVLAFAGVLTDRVGPGAAQLAPDTLPDAVFTLGLSIGSGVTRTLRSIELLGPGSLVRSTRAEAGAALGVAASAATAFLNEASGEVSFQITSAAALTLIASDVGGFVAAGTTYVVTVEFTDGSRFVGTHTLVAERDRPQMVHSAVVSAEQLTVTGTAAQPGSTLLTLSDIRDIQGQPVPDGARLALSAVDMASKDPRGAALRSAGGTIEGGDPAPNNPSFRVFTVVGGEVQATYSSAPVEPAAVSGALAVVQVLPADAAGNVLGQEAVATLDLNLRRPNDRAILIPEATTRYADTADRRVSVRVELRDANGNLETGVTRHVIVTAGPGSSFVGGQYVPSAGGTVYGGVDSPSYNGVGVRYRWFTTTTGTFDLEYSASGLSTGVGLVQTAAIQVLDASASGGYINGNAIGVGQIALTGPSSAAIQVSPESVPLVNPARLAQVHVFDVRDGRNNLVPDGARVLLSVAHGASMQGSTSVASAGGAILEGQVWGTYYKGFPLTGGSVVATYSSDGLTAPPSTILQVAVQLLMADQANNRVGSQAITVKGLRLLAPAHAVGDAEPPYLQADGTLRTSTVAFDPVLDAWGNPLPDGSKVVVSAANSVGKQAGVWILSDGGSVLNGTSSPSGGNYRVLTVQGGAAAATYSAQGLTATPGQTKTARLVLLEANANGQVASTEALGMVPIELSGVTSATLQASASSVLVDGSDRRVTVTISQIKDAAGRVVPDGTLVLVTAANNATTVGGTWVLSYGGTIVGGTASPTAGFKSFLVTSGQVVFEYSTSGLTVPTATQTARIQVAAANADGSRLSTVALGTLPLTLTVPGSAVISFQPADMLADGGARLAQVTLGELKDSSGNSLPDGSKVALTVVNNAARTPAGVYILSDGGAIQTAGTTPGDGTSTTNNASFKQFTIAGGEVHAVYSAAGLKPGVNQTLVARLSIAPASAAGALVSNYAVATAELPLRGTSTATASGPSSLTAGSGTVTFGAIKDAAGNTVADGTLVAVKVSNCGTVDYATSACNASTGGTITNGTTSGSYKLFSVSGGAISVNYSTTGATAGTARVQVQPAASDGTLISNKSLIGGVWAIQVTP